MYLTDIIFNLFTTIFVPFYEFLFNASNNFYAVFQFDDTITLGLFGVEFATMALSDLFLYFCLFLFVFVLLRFFYKFIKWLFSIPKKLGGRF